VHSASTVKDFLEEEFCTVKFTTCEKFLRGIIEGETVYTVRKLPVVESLHCWISVREVRDCCTGGKSASEGCFWMVKDLGKDFR
jgi:hypothetical protein